jgi:2-polyprenyl-3-methyl-5-hydroxy-6-metoxy-1,4-benzoquinol methylase
MATHPENPITVETAQQQVAALYTRRTHSYVAYVQAFGHRQGLRALLESSPALQTGQRILDAGCGTGLSILALLDALHRRRLTPRRIDGFDLTPAMLGACRHTLTRRGVSGVELRHADITRLDEHLPPSWSGYDLIVCTSMLEHLPRTMLPSALAGLGARLATGGRILVVVTRRSFYPTRWLWHCQGYTPSELTSMARAAGLDRVTIRHYPPATSWLNLGNLAIEAGPTEGWIC